MTSPPKTFELIRSYDIVQVRQYARQASRALGFSLTDQTRIATAVSEIARQILRNQKRGRVLFAVVERNSRQGFQCTFPNLDWIQAATPSHKEDLFGGVARLMDEFQLQQSEDEPVSLVMCKWLRPE